MKLIFKYSGILLEALEKHSGESVTILWELGDDERDWEIGRMFHIEFPDGDTADVFGNELFVTL